MSPRSASTALVAGLTALAAGVTLTAGGAAVAAGAAPRAGTPAAAVADQAPVAAGTAWLSGQLTGGLIHNQQYDFDDYGLTVDAGLGLHAVGDNADVATISAALAPHVADYYSYEVDDSSTPPKSLGTHVSAGSLAKAAVFAQAAGADPKAYGGHDLISELDARVSTAPTSLGRISDQVVTGGAYESDFANTIGQAFAVNALTAANDPRAGAALNYLTAQQCSAGYFRLALSANSADTCDAASAVDTPPNNDVTALAVLQLQGNPLASQSVSKAVSWLKSQQKSDGGFTDGSTSGPTSGVENANSTGLAGWALRVAGDTDDANQAVSYLEALQAADPAACGSRLTADNGAIAYDPTAKKTARTKGIIDATADQFRRATAQALPGLVYSPPPPGGPIGDPAFPRTFVHHGGFVRRHQALTFRVVSPPSPSTICVHGAGGPGDLIDVTSKRHLDIRRAGVSSLGSAKVLLSTVDGTLAPARFHVVGPKRLHIVAPSHAARRSHVMVQLRGLAANEPFKLELGGRTVAKSAADGRGRYSMRIKVGKPGRELLRVRGAFGDRTGSTVIVVRHP